MSEIKAIPTRYKGCHFRSRLEARWAVFFDSMGWFWTYETEGYHLPRLGGRYYLPDFSVKPPNTRLLIEIKPHTTLALEDVIADDQPIWNLLDIVLSESPQTQQPAVFYGDPGDFMLLAPHYNATPNDLFTFKRIRYETAFSYSKSTFVLAAMAARSARFEHGESGAT